MEELSGGLVTGHHTPSVLSSSPQHRQQQDTVIYIFVGKAILTLVYRQSKMIKLEKKSEYLSCRKDLRVLCILLQILHIV